MRTIFTPNTSRASRAGFTLVELVVVVLVLGILAAVAAPKMFDTYSDARVSATRQSLSVVRDSLELYRAKNESYPAQETIAEDLDDYLKGPFPAPEVGANRGSPTVADSAEEPITTVSGNGEGWIYNDSTGEFRVNDAAYLAW